MRPRSVKTEPHLIRAEKQQSAASSPETLFQGTRTKILSAGIHLMACAKNTPSAQLAGLSRIVRMGKRPLLYLLLSVPTNTNVGQVLGGAIVSSELTQLGKEGEVHLQKCINSG